MKKGQVLSGDAAHERREKKIRDHYIEIRNKLTAGTQNARVWDYLYQNGEINCYEASRDNPPIMALHSRIAELRALGAEIYGVTEYIRGTRYHTYFTERNECSFEHGKHCESLLGCDGYGCPNYPYNPEPIENEIELIKSDKWIDERLDAEVWGNA